MEDLININPTDFGLPDVPTSNTTERQRTSSTSPTKPLEYNPDLVSNFYKESVRSEPQGLRNIEQSYDSQLFEKYKGTAAYTPWMDPYADNESVAAENWSKWDAVSTGLSGLLDNAKLGGFEYAKGWSRAGRALITLDGSYLTPSEEELSLISEEQRQTGINNPIYYKPGTHDDIISRQFLSEALQNSGFTFGTLAGFAADVALFRGIGVVGSKLPLLFKAGIESKSIQMASEVGTLSNVAGKEMILEETARNMIKNGGAGALGGKTLYDQALNVASHVPILGALAETGKVIQGQQVARASLGIVPMTSQEVARIGRGGLMRAYQEWNFAASEAAIEAGGTYGDVYDTNYNTYLDKNGKDPTGYDLQNIRDNAMKAAGTGYATNMAVLAVMNKIQFGNIFRKFGVDSKYMNLLNNESSRYMAVLGKDKAGKMLAKTYTRGYFGAISNAGDIKRLFGNAVLAKEITRDFIKGASKFELTEGIQENIQEGTNNALKKHYADLYNNDVASWSDSFQEGVDSQATKTGFKTFLQGAITGFFVSPITGAASALSDKLGGNAQHREALRSTLDSMNHFAMDPTKVLQDHVKMIKEQSIFNRAMAQSASVNRKYDYFNNKSSALIQQAMNAKKTGTFKAFKTLLSSYGSEFDNDSFEQATGISVGEFDMDSPSHFIGSLIKKLDRYAEIYDKYSDMFSHHFDITTYGDDAFAKQKYSIAKSAIQDAIQTIAFNEAKAEDATVRSGEIVRNISQKNKSIGQAATSTFNNITDHTNGELQVNILANELKILEETTGPKTKETLDLIEDKKQELTLLRQWNEEAYEEVEDPENPGETLNFPLSVDAIDDQKKRTLTNILSRYYEIKNKQMDVKTPIVESEMNDIIMDINDYQKLTKDVRGYIDAVNLLSDPGNAVNYIHNIQSARVSAFARNVHSEYLRLAETSGIFEQYIKDNPEDMQELLNLARSPFVDLNSMTKIYDHYGKINEMVEKANVKAMEDHQKMMQNLILAAPVNIALMSEDEIKDFADSHYYLNDTDEIIRFYTNVDGEEIETNTVSPDEIKDYFGEDFIMADISNLEVLQFVTQYEQALYDIDNPSVNSRSQAGHKKQTIINETRKLKNLVGKTFLFLGEEAKLDLEDGKYILTYDDGSITTLGSDPESEQDYVWEFNPKTGTYRLIDQSNQLTVQDFVGLELSDVSLTPEEIALTGINSNVIMMRDFFVEYVSEEEVIIDGSVYLVDRDPSTGEVLSLYTEDGSSIIEYTSEAAQKDPTGADANHIALVDIFLNVQNKAPEDFTDEELDAALLEASLLSLESDRLIGAAIREKEDYINSQKRAEELMGDGVSDDIIIIFDKFLTPKTRKTMSETEIDDLFSWGTETLAELKALDPKNKNEVIQNLIDYLSKQVVNPIVRKNRRKNGIKSVTKSPGKSSKKKTTTVKVTRKTKSKKGEPSTPKNERVKSIKEARKHIEKLFDKMEREIAVKIDVLKPGSQLNMFSESNLEDAVSFSKYNMKRSDENLLSGLNPKIENPFEDNDLLDGLTCNT